jgi:hypothetical protein
VAVEAARRLVTDGARPGVLTPAQGYDPAGFLNFLARYENQLGYLGFRHLGSALTGTLPPEQVAMPRLALVEWMVRPGRRGKGVGGG